MLSSLKMQMPWYSVLNVSLSCMELFFHLQIRSHKSNLTYSIQGSSGESYTLYTAKAIQETKPLCLTHGGMVLIALLSGGDYSKGIPGCGFSISSALARCGFGDSLLYAFNSMAPKDLETYMEQWCNDLQDELHSNSMGNLHSKQVHLAAQIPSNFIDHDILELYLKPCTSSIGPNSTYNTADWRSREPSIGKIANFCSQKFGWKTTEALAQNMRNNLWEGVFFRMLASVCIGFLKFCLNSDVHLVCNPLWPKPTSLWYSIHIGNCHQNWVQKASSTIQNLGPYSIESRKLHCIVESST